MISGCEKMTCTGTCAMKSVTFSLMVLLNFVQSSFFTCIIDMDYAMGISSFSVYFAAGSIYHSMCSGIIS